VTPSTRIASLDILRGVALLGILVMNIQSFGLIEAAYWNPTAYGDLTGANRWVSHLAMILVDTKFMAIFSMMFGASTLLILERSQEQGRSPIRTHLRRNSTLLVVGFLHGQLLWYGDILYHYALCSFALLPFRHRRVRTLWIWGILILLIASLILLAGGLTRDHWSEAQRTEFLEGWQPPPEAIDAELRAYRGSWSDQNRFRSTSATEMQTVGFLSYVSWRSLGMMLIGMALYRMGVLHARRSRRFYAGLLAMGFLVGLPMVSLRVFSSEAAGWEPFASFFLHLQWNYWGSLAVALGWIGLVMLVCQAPGMSRRLAPLGDVGRMAFTNYLAQTLIATTIFYGHGLGWFGRLERVQLMGLVVGIWILQIAGSTLWMRYFVYGPAEWAWRWATHMERPPLRRRGTDG